ncbi:hypothetical protein CPSG_01691 [Coccidioides posadasii str. Silveira]|uniref:Uncharacterized protein n=2 Tax=Coccidioides posadasii TaxID=199306 RepID=E9CW58_COCPS|nr:hypothetical protein CPSG_01691 [Coccidioides posadasii str. Silveira]KMM65011.1 hypothetical protein CPAG_01363 [Coccidioides posadasii RMSCC 3488]
MKPSYILSLLGLQVASVMAIPVESDALSMPYFLLKLVSGLDVACHAGADAVAIAAHQALPTAFGLVAAAGVRAAKQVRPRGVAWLSAV